MPLEENAFRASGDLGMSRTNDLRHLILALCCLASDLMLKAQTAGFHHEPAYAKTLKPSGETGLPDAESSSEAALPPKPPFTDYRFEKPGQIHKITLKD